MSGERFTLMRAAPSSLSSASSVSDASEARTVTPSEGTTNAYTFSYDSTNYGDVTNEAAFRPFTLDTPSERMIQNRLHAGPTRSRLPELKIPGADTLIFFNPSRQDQLPKESLSPPFEILSSALLSTKSQVFEALLTPNAQARYRKSLVRQHKLSPDGSLPLGIRFVIDMTPPEEGEAVIQWMERLWCPDEFLEWKSALDDYENIYDDAPMDDKPDFLAMIVADESKLKKAGESDGNAIEGFGRRNSIPASKTRSKPANYSFDRHLLALQRLIYILHGFDPIIKSTPDWYTLHCLSCYFGTKPATMDYTSKWIYANTLIIEVLSNLIFQVANDAELPMVVADAWSATVMRLLVSDMPELRSVYGAVEARDALQERIRIAIDQLFEYQTRLLDEVPKMSLMCDPGWWFQTYLPEPHYAEDTPKSQAFFTFVNSLHEYIVSSVRQCSIYSTELFIALSEKRCAEIAFQREFWESIKRNVMLWNADDPDTFLESRAGSDYSRSRENLRNVVRDWKKWEELGGSEDIDGRGELNTFAWEDVMKIKGGMTIDQLQSSDEKHIDEEKDEKHIDKESDDFDTAAIDETGTVMDDNASVSNASTTADLCQNLNELNVKPSLRRRRNSNDTVVTATSEQEQEQEENDEPVTEDTSIYFDVNPHNNAPFWLVNSLVSLRQEYPYDTFYGFKHLEPTFADNGLRITCRDCPEKIYFTGPGNTADNYIRHLKLDLHRHRVNLRVSTKGYVADMPKHRYPSTWDYSRTKRFTQPVVVEEPLNCPAALANILGACQDHVVRMAEGFLLMGVSFEPLILEGRVACLEESEKKFMPLWAGGEVTAQTNAQSSTARKVENEGTMDSESSSVFDGVSSTGIRSSAASSGVYVPSEVGVESVQSIDSMESDELVDNTIEDDDVDDLDNFRFDSDGEDEDMDMFEDSDDEGSDHMDDDAFGL